MIKANLQDIINYYPSFAPTHLTCHCEDQPVGIGEIIFCF